MDTIRRDPEGSQCSSSYDSKEALRGIQEDSFRRRLARTPRLKHAEITLQICEAGTWSPSGDRAFLAVP